MSGILGLGFKSLNTVRPDQQNTFFDNVKSSLASPIFTTTLKHQAPGSLDLGYIDATKHTAPISYTKVDNSDGFWDITIDSYIVGKGSAITTGFHGVVDTGAPFLFLDDSVVITYYSQVEGAGYDYTQGGYTFACNTTLPDITFSTNGYDAVVPGKLMSFDAMDNGGTMCFGGLQSNDGLPGNIFGDPLLKSQFVVFDTNGPRMGFAPQA